MTEPTELAQLRHLYQNMVNGAVRDTASAKRIAEGLLAPAIEALERGTPPAAQGDAEDAARYRCIRRGQHLSVIDGIGNELRAEALDTAIDAVRSQAKEGGA